MYFASPLPWSLGVLAAVAIAGLVFFSYRRPMVRLSAVQRAVLMGLRTLTLALLVLLLCRPIVLMPPSSAVEVVVPILVDVSRSMRVADADGETRIARAADLLQRELLPRLSAPFKPEIYSIGEALTPTLPDRLSADGRQSDLAGALVAVRDRYRGRGVPGIIVLSDGGDTGPAGGAPAVEGAPIPAFTIGIGSPEGIRDREILGVATSDPRLDQASVDLHVSAVSHRYGSAPFQLRLLANGRVLDSRAVTPAADGSPVDALFTVSPDPANANVYTVEIAPEQDESIRENNSRTVLVNPAGRKRRILALAGAPGHEHSFITRALTNDSGLEFDAVVRKGKNENGEDTFFIQAGGGRAEALTSGFPSTREALYAYDALVIANIEADFFTRVQLAQAAEFVAERGGGLLVLGGRSFAQRGLIGTPLEEALPVELNDRRGGVVRAALRAARPAAQNTVIVTAEGERHAVMRLGASPEETREIWAALPALAASAPLGGPKPGAAVLAVTTAPAGAVHALVAVQRYGRGRSMVFGGEASWRWRMMRPSTDRSYEFFWRQAARWLAGPTPDPVAVSVPDSSEPGDSIDIDIDVRDRTFTPVPDAVVAATLAVPGGDTRSLTLRRDSSTSGRFTAALRPTEAGLYRVQAEAHRGGAVLGSADHRFYVGGRDREFAEPRLNEGVLRRVAQATGGQYVRAEEASRVVSSWLQSIVRQPAEPERRDLWHEPWTFALVIGLLSAEWILRRRWGLR
ncbi:MAG: hypothetical protein A3G25_06265 [Betaproteobacteria bacterium RIFCSPLOWO2_12_FULL_63_13]|nr:MAG: hypothetical protein A3G25_06265 [Betaproteobacteria bacterium RIFCSPLOWO2_12_FULL_63_13]